MKKLLLTLLFILHVTNLEAATHLPFLPPPGSWEINSDYGPRKYNGWTFHDGIDYLASRGSDLRAVEDGAITEIRRSGSGWCVRISGNNGYWDYRKLYSGGVL